MLTAHDRAHTNSWRVGSSEKSCRDGPILLAFFLNFLLRNRVFPEADKKLRKAVAAAELAQKELPHSFVISRGIPDAFSRGCEHLFGTMVDHSGWKTAAGEDADASAESGDEGAPGAKRQKTDTPAEAAVLQEALGPADIEVVTADTMREMEEAAKEAGIDAPAWGAPDPAAAADPAAEGQTWGDANAAWGAPDEPLVWDTTPKANSLHEYLGATALPLTHTTGIVERSTRRVKAVIPPRAQQGRSGRRGANGQASEGPTPEGVERDLEARLAQVVLAPWEEWDAYDKADVTKPAILVQSRGPVVREVDEPEPAPIAEGAPPPHNPFKNEITLLADPAVAETLWVGTGVQATWVQLARTDPGVHLEVGGLGEPVAPTKFWYMEQVLAVLPTFHTEMVPLPTTQDVFGEEA